MDNREIKKYKPGTLFKIKTSTWAWKKYGKNYGKKGHNSGVPETGIVFVESDQIALLVKTPKKFIESKFLVNEGVVYIPGVSIELARQ